MPVARVEHRAAHRVVRTPQGVESRVLQQAHTAILRGVDRDRSERAVVVVNAGTAEFHDVTVDPQPVLRIQLQATDAEGRGIRVDLCAVLIKGYGAHFVQRGMVGVPQLRSRDDEPRTRDGARAGQDRDRCRAASHLHAVRRRDRPRDPHRPGVPGVVHDLGRDRDRPPRQRRCRAS